jgi:hypothetical protein
MRDAKQHKLPGEKDREMQDFDIVHHLKRVQDDTIAERKPERKAVLR